MESCNILIKIYVIRKIKKKKKHNVNLSISCSEWVFTYIVYFFDNNYVYDVQKMFEYENIRN